MTMPDKALRTYHYNYLKCCVLYLCVVANVGEYVQIIFVYKIIFFKQPWKGWSAHKMAKALGIYAHHLPGIKRQ